MFWHRLEKSLQYLHANRILSIIVYNYCLLYTSKSNVIRAFWLAVQFIKNAQRTQHENARIPVIPFALNDYSKEDVYKRQDVTRQVR